MQLFGANNFSNALYPHQRLRNLIALLLLLAMHALLVYGLLYKKVDTPLKPPEMTGQLVFLDLPAITTSSDVTAHINQPKSTPKRNKGSSARSKPAPKAVAKPKLVPPPVDTMSRVMAARKKRMTIEEEISQQSRATESASQSVSENDLALARINANIQAANYHRKGKNGIFQVLQKGVQTGRFAFRGWDNNARESSWQTYEVDAGVGGDVELALVRRMIEIIREHYSGDFNWESPRLGRVIVLSARQKDNAELERFLMKEFFGNQ